MKQQLNELIDNFAKDFKAIVNQDEQPKLEKGKWYYYDTDKILLNTEKPETCGFWLGEWHNEVTFYGILKPARIATDQEVLDIAKNYLEGTLGFTEGCKFKSAYSGIEYKYKLPLYIANDGDILTNGGNVLFNHNTHKWAELIKDEDIYIGENKVGFIQSGININGYYLNKNCIKSLLPSNPELFGKILERLNK